MNRIVSIAKTEFELTLKLIIVACVVGTVASYGSSFWISLQNLSSFVQYYFIAALILGLVMVIRRDWRWVLACSALVVFHGWPLMSLIGAPKDECEGRMEVASINFYVNNQEPETVFAYVREHQPDVLYVSELLEENHQELAELFPYSWADTTESYNGLYSKHPILSVAPDRHLMRRSRVVDAIISVGGQEVRVLGLHPPPPLVRLVALRDEVLADAAERLRDETKPVIVLGDFNATMWTPGYQPLAGLKNAREGREIAGTWPLALPVRIPIDHILTSQDVGICSFELGDSVGSDHLPIRAGIDLNPSGTLASWSHGIKE